MSAVTLPQKAGFVATTDEWDALVRIAENLAAQVVQRDAALRQTEAERDAARQHSPHNYVHKAMFDQVVEQRDAARAEVARLTDSVNKSARALELWAHDADQFSQRTSDGQALISDDDLNAVKTIAAALRQPAPAQGQE